MKIRIHRKNKDIPLPERKTPRSAGLDIYAAGRAELHPGKVALISTGLIIETPPGYFYKVHIRSGLSVKHGICLANDVGIFEKNALPEIEWEEMEQADFAGKTRGGFGSTGLN